MNDLKKQVQQARWRLNLQQFLSVVFWTLTSALAIAAIGVAIPKIWPLALDPVVWQWSWIAGSVVAGIVAAVVWTILRTPGEIDAAIEIDKRFGLKERVSSCLALDEQETQTEAGQALVDDAVRRVAEVDVKEGFKISPSRTAWLPLAMAVAVFGVTMLSDAQLDQPNGQLNAATVQNSKQVKKSTDALKKKIRERQKKALEQGLKETTDLFKKIEAGVDRLQSKKKVDKKEALIKLNDFADELKKRAQQLGDPEKLKQQLSQMKDLKQGPADKMARAMKRGDFKTAIEAVKDLQKKLEKNALSETEKKQLTEQLEQMKNKLQQMAEAHEAQKQQLQEQIKQKLASGDRQGAADLQKKLDDLMNQDSQMNDMQSMAQKLGQMQKSMQKGDAKKTAEQLSQLADDLEGMQEEMEELELLEDAMQQIADAKSSMSCQNCNGAGCSMCQGDGMGAGMGQMPGMGMGEGRGQGDRPESETGTGFYDSQVAAKPGKGKAVVIGSAGGPNKPGQALQEIQQQFEAAQSADEDPLTGVRLPKPQRELTKQYFDKFRE